MAGIDASIHETVKIFARCEGLDDIELGELSWDVEILVDPSKSDSFDVMVNTGKSLSRLIIDTLRQIADETEAKLDAAAADDLIGSEPTA